MEIVLYVDGGEMKQRAFTRAWMAKLWALCGRGRWYAGALYGSTVSAGY